MQAAGQDDHAENFVFADWFGEGWKIPFPEGMNFIQGTVQYQNVSLT